MTRARLRSWWRPAPRLPRHQRDDGGEPLVRTGLRGFLALERRDVVAVVALVVVSLFLRFASPILPDFLSGSGGVNISGIGAATSNNSPPPECTDVPVGPPGKDSTGTVVTHTDVKRCGFIFDEIYFPVDAARDLRQPAESYFDPEPPLAKLLMAPPIATMGFTTWSWRVSTAIFGSLLVGVVYLLALRLRRDRWFAGLAALFVSLDGLAFVEARTGVIDIIAIFFVALFYYLFLLHWQARTRRQWRATLYLMALVAGLAFAAKLTALAPLVVAAALIVARGISPWLAGLVPAVRRIAGPRRHEVSMWRAAAGRVALVHYTLAILIGGAIFCASFSRYLTIPHTDVYRFTACEPGTTGLTGTADAIQVPTMKIGSATLPNPVQAIADISDVMAAGLQYHEQECHSHPYASRWYTWPIVYHPVLFYYVQTNAVLPDNPTVSSITDMGNPAVWWLSIPALLALVWRLSRGPPWWRLLVGLVGPASLATMIITFHAAQKPDTVSVRVSPGALFTAAFVGIILFAALITVSAVVSRRFVPAFIVLGYLTSWMLWVIGNERRVLFFYHALGMLIFAALAFAYVLAGLRNTVVQVRGRRISLAPVTWAATLAVVAGFIFFYPVWTAVPMPDTDHQMRLWVDAW
ncbi:MAG: phospholipid carrier-dependent glycosyltransferase [Candidatus Dormibacteraeota bacterium]|uniref:Polyprenol-phosphate-mannose--protein mannosyltransferase n=1 Tax=Candidatus Aeolococcus gillhamiae TaxID=3127015 RepID=A0A934JUW7_9BACT|nr:phospholipid carrier-dependent glycosyltransferase [Candidatus Dormibacteraeota bacterium]